MNNEWFAAAVVIAIVFFTANIVYSSIGLFSNDWMSSMFGAAFILGALIVVVLLSKPLFFPTKEPQQ